MSGQAPNGGPEMGSRSDQAAASPVEDGRSPVAGTPRRELTTSTKLSILALVAVLGLGFIWFNALFSHKRADQQKIIPAAYTNGGEVFNGPPDAAMKPAAQNLPTPANTQTGLLDTPAQASPAAAPILAFSGSSVPVPIQPASSSASQPGATAAVTPMPDNSPLAARLKPTVLDGEQATVMQHPDMVITEGTMIPCTLQTAIDSQLPGLVTCVVPIDIRGA
ncbi:MAG: hypothetical protein B7Z75_14930, partial [Acidocella sp. 20-57-95]